MAGATGDALILPSHRSGTSLFESSLNGRHCLQNVFPPLSNKSKTRSTLGNAASHAHALLLRKSIKSGRIAYVPDDVLLLKLRNVRAMYREFNIPP